MAIATVINGEHSFLFSFEDPNSPEVGVCRDCLCCMNNERLFTYLKVIGWCWFYLSTILDDYSRFFIASMLCTMMSAEDVPDSLDRALQASGCDQAKVLHKPRLLNDNGMSYISGELVDWLEDQKMDHERIKRKTIETQHSLHRKSAA